MDGPPPKAARYLTHVLEELGLASMYKSPLDTKLLCFQRFVRLFAYGGSTLILVAYLAALGYSKSRIGLFMTLTLVGDTIISFFLTLIADGLGRKAILALGALLMAASGVVFGLSGNYWVLLVAAIFGVISPRYDSQTTHSPSRQLTSTVAMRLGLLGPSRNRRLHSSRPLPSGATSSPGTHS
jgi:MFS family permease